MGSNFTFAQVNSEEYWEIGLKDVLVNNQSVGVCSWLMEKSDKCGAAIDTGTSLLAGPSEVIDMIMQSLGVEEDCSNYDRLADIQIVLEEGVLVMSKEDYVIRQDNS